MELFLNPWYMVAGGAMVSSPIIIHLINRIRFKRIRWAAMEFLLKSQKRNRRRLIIEQLILLLLRILLVLLAGFLLARFIGSALGLTPSSSTLHVVVLDDTVSMNDRWHENRLPKDSFGVARTQLAELARKASLANSPQFIKVIRLSDGEIVFEDRINDTSITEMTKKLDGLKPTNRHVPAANGIEEAKKRLAEHRDGRRWLHFVGDFRERDWGDGPGTQDLHASLRTLVDAGTNVGLIDAAHPDRSETKQVTVAHDNYAITELRPESRIAPTNIPIRFGVEIANMGSGSKENIFLEVYIDGVLDFRCSRPVEAPRPRSRVRYEFDVMFTTPGFSTITARLKDVDTENGLLADNVRNSIIEIREKVPTLVIDGNGTDGLKPGGDTLMVQTALTVAKGYQVSQKGVEELERPDLAKAYPTIYLLNVDEIKSEKARNNLKQYVEAGGNIVYFLGPKVRVSHYNNVLYKQYEGLFPVPLEDRPTDGISDEVKQRRRSTPQPKVFVRDGNHPAMRGVFKEQDRMYSLIISRYFRSNRAGWSEKLTSKDQLQELITLPNLNSLDSFKQETLGLVADIKKLIEEHPKELSQFSKRVAVWDKEIFSTLEEAKSDELFKLAGVLEAFLADKGEKPPEVKPGEKVDPSKMPVDFTLFWQAPEMRDLKARVENLRDRVQFGDPLAVVRKYGKGRVVAFMTTAGRGSGEQGKPEDEWNDWSGGSDASITFPILMLDLQRYLTSGGDDGGRTVGDVLRFELDENLYKNEVNVFAQEDFKEEQPGAAPPPPVPVDPSKPKARGGFVHFATKNDLPVQDGKVVFEFKDAADPKVYYFEFSLKPKEGVVAPPPEERWFAYNIDTEAESNLARASREQLERNPAGATIEKGKITLFTPSDNFDVLKEKKKDLSESAWLYLVLLLILIAEQALAVHLSHHLRGSEAAPGVASTTGAGPAPQPVPTAA